MQRLNISKSVTFRRGGGHTQRIHNEKIARKDYTLVKLKRSVCLVMCVLELLPYSGQAQCLNSIPGAPIHLYRLNLYNAPCNVLTIISVFFYIGDFISCFFTFISCETSIICTISFINIL